MICLRFACAGAWRWTTPHFSRCAWRRNPRVRLDGNDAGWTTRGVPSGISRRDGALEDRKDI